MALISDILSACLNHFLFIVHFYQHTKLLMIDSLPCQSLAVSYANKNEPKRAPRCPGPLGCLALLAVNGTLKTHRLRRLKQVQRLIPSTAAMLSGTEWGPKYKNLLYSKKAISRSRAAKKREE
jgi:hypothetical protein